MSTLQARILRIASILPKGDETRREILAVLDGHQKRAVPEPRLQAAMKALVPLFPTSPRLVMVMYREMLGDEVTIEPMWQKAPRSWDFDGEYEGDYDYDEGYGEYATSHTFSYTHPEQAHIKATFSVPKAKLARVLAENYRNDLKLPKKVAEEAFLKVLLDRKGAYYLCMALSWGLQGYLDGDPEEIFMGMDKGFHDELEDLFSGEGFVPNPTFSDTETTVSFKLSGGAVAFTATISASLDYEALEFDVNEVEYDYDGPEPEPDYDGPYDEVYF